MAKIKIDLTGRGGLAPGYQGDLNDTVAKPHLRYIGNEDQVADGLFNPFRTLGYMSPANNKFLALTGTIPDAINARIYDSVNDDLYFSCNSANLLKLDGLDDTSFTTVGSASLDWDIKDLELYEVNGEPSILFAYADNEQNSGVDDLGIKIGFRTLDASRGAFPLAARVVGVLSSANMFDEEILAGSNEKLAQKFLTSDMAYVGDVSGVRVRLQTVGGLGQTWTLRIGIQTNNAGRPSGTYVTNAYVDIDPNTVSASGGYIYAQFPASVSLNGTYHIVVEPTNFAQLSGAEGVIWKRSDNGNSQYSNGEAQQYIAAAWANADGSTSESFDFALIINNSYALVNSSTSTGSIANGALTNTSRTDNVFLIKADNGFLYAFTRNRVHKFDGTLTGGDTGNFTEDVLTFPKYIYTVDAVDTASLMYIAIQSTPLLTSADYRTFGADTMGVYVWDRQTLVANTRSFIPIYGAKEIKKIFVNGDGDLRVITIGEDRFTEIRGVVNGKLVVIKRLGLNAYPRYRDAVDYMNNMTIWLGADGIIYALGKLQANDSEGLYKIGDMSAESAGALLTGVISVGHTESTQSRQGVFLSFTDGSTQKAKKWYPHGVGTIGGVAQTGHVGNIYTLLQILPDLATLKHINIMCVPGSSTGTTTVATIKFYANQSTTPFATKTVTYNDIKRGYVDKELNKPYTNSIQMKIEYPTGTTLGDDDFRPMYAILEYAPATRDNKTSMGK